MSSALDRRPILDTVEDSFTRPANVTAYAAGYAVANSATAGSVAMMTFAVGDGPSWPAKIKRAYIRKSGTGVGNATFILHLYANSIASAAGDNAAYSTAITGYLGQIPITVDEAFSDGAYGDGVPAAGDGIILKTGTGQTISGLLEATGAYTPASAEVITVGLELERAGKR